MMAAYDTRNPAAYKRMIGSGTRAQLFPNNFMIAAYRGAFAIYDAGPLAAGIQEDLRPVETVPQRDQRMAQDGRGGDDQFPRQLARGG